MFDGIADDPLVLMPTADAIKTEPSEKSLPDVSSEMRKDGLRNEDAEQDQTGLGVAKSPEPMVLSSGGTFEGSLGWSIDQGGVG